MSQTKESRFRQFVSTYQDVIGCNYNYLTAEVRAHMWAAYQKGYEQRTRDNRKAKRK